MSFEVKRFINSPVTSNCFVIYRRGFQSCLIIDPGTRDCEDLLIFLKEMNLVPEIVILTHEHYDHIWGVNLLKETYNCMVKCSAKCSEKIVNKKKNMSVFHDQIGFETAPADIFTDNIKGAFLWNDISLKFLDTPGHTDCGISILVEDKLFVGDLIIDGHKTVTKLPTGNKTDVLNSVNKLLNDLLPSAIEVYSGHGNNFMLNEVDISILV